MTKASFDGTLHLPSLNLQLPIQQSHYRWQQHQDHRGRPRSKVRFGSLQIEVLATQAQLTELSELAANSYAVLDGHAAYTHADGQGTFVTVWFRQARLHHFTEHFDATGTRGSEPSWVVQFALAPEEMGRESGTSGEFVMPAPREHGKPVAVSRVVPKLLGQLGSEAGDAAKSASQTARGSVFPGPQRYNNCGVQCCQQIVRQVTGINYEEEELLEKAIAKPGCYAYDDNMGPFHGLTSDESMRDFLNVQGIPATVFKTPTRVSVDDRAAGKTLKEFQITSLTKKLTEALKENKGVIAAVDSGQLWHNSPTGDGHAVLITTGLFDEEGQLTHVLLNDTAVANIEHQQNRRLSTTEILSAFTEFRDLAGRNNSSLIITNAPIWT
ncbi:type VI secretion system tube protein TssD [Hymenobacter sp.]|jgi:hypothetical protein|uniref:type VI secretion system tube protein TssD n=1 Tax=Hymenobacter sp. TaxID=1898978 RepID=UPI002EDADBFA